ncbi:MAG: hypothetical protein RL318_2825 [Fibrobacterota bacterium]|jgi:hypothetical protein
MKFPAFLALLAVPLWAQGLPRNIEMSLASDASGLWVVNSEGQITRVKNAGASQSNFTTWEPGGRTVNSAADYPIWRGASHQGRMLFPVATTDSKGRGLLGGFWKHDSTGVGRILTNAATGTLRPVPDQWVNVNDTLLASADSSQILWQLDKEDSLSALGLANTGSLVTLARCGACSLADAVKARATDSLRFIQGISRDPVSKSLLVATTTGLWSGTGPTLTKSSHPSLSKGNVLGVWAGPGGIYAQTDSTLWHLDSVNGTPRKIAGDSALVVDHRISAVAWTADSTAWVLLRTANYGLSGVLRLKHGRVVSLSKGTTPTLIDAEDGLPFSKEVNLSDITLEPAHDGEPSRLWIGSRGEGLAMTSDAGGKWTLVSHKAALRTGLKEVRIIPTRLESGASLVGYSLATDGNVDIEIFNGAMEPVRTLVKGEFRPASLRSEDPIKDRWDGCTDQGKLATIGLYYVRVKSGSQVAWGKVFQLKGGSSCAR